MSTKNSKTNQSVNVADSKNIVTTQNGQIISANVKKELAEKNLNDLFALHDLSNKVSSKGSKKETLYRSEYFSDCVTDKDKKALRRKIRNMLDSYIGDVFYQYKEKQTDKLLKTVKDFNSFYSKVYLLNDYSLQSLISANTSDFKKDNLKIFLDIVQRINSLNKEEKKK